MLQGLSSGKQKTHGFEIMIRKDLRENEDGLYGWMSYTYTRSQVLNPDCLQTIIIKEFIDEQGYYMVIQMEIDI